MRKRRHPLDREPRELTVRELKELLVFWREASARNAEHMEEIERLFSHTVFAQWGRSDWDRIDAGDLSRILTRWNAEREKKGALCKPVLLNVMRTLGLLDGIRLSGLTSEATLIWLRDFARGGRGLKLPDKDFGWVGLEKVAQDPVATARYCTSFVFREGVGPVDDDTRRVLASALARDPRTAILSVALFDFDPTDEAKQTLLRYGSAVDLAVYLYLSGGEVDGQCRKKVDANSLAASLVKKIEAGRPDLGPIPFGKDGKIRLRVGLAKAPAVVLYRVLRILEGMRLFSDLVHSSDYVALRAVRSAYWMGKDELLTALTGFSLLVPGTDGFTNLMSWAFSCKAETIKSAIKFLIRMFPESEEVHEAVGRTNSPRTAYHYSKAIGRPIAQLRVAASKDPLCAFYYAKCVDRGPHDVTRRGASRSQYLALRYAKEVDNGPHYVTRAGICRPSLYSFTTNSALLALLYARDVDKGPHPMTRIAASTYYSVRYAQEVDRRPHPVTRTMACSSPVDALEYALKIDRKATAETFAAVAGTEYESKYVEVLGRPEDQT